jgi:cyclophilin family peptidyl-prolyl cis-trans isomerase
MGPGPYRVQFTIVIANDTGKRNFKKFVVELAPLNLMPHAVHFFLDMVNAGIWDNTVFLHHEKLDHVIAAAPIDCETHEIKNIPIQKLGWSTMGFPEYADELPHSKYTLAFSGNGPTFYINTLDNTKTHGPGVQGHYLLPEEADPVFATVVDGTDVVDEMIEFGIHQQKPPKVEGHPWADEPHTWSRIVNVRVLKS